MKRNSEGNAAGRARIGFPARILAFSCLCLLATTSFAESRRVGAEPAIGIVRVADEASLGPKIASLLPAENGSILLFGRPDQLLPLLRSPELSGRLKEISFVLPEEGSLTPDTEGWFRSILEQDGVLEYERAGFRLDNGVFHGQAGSRRISFRSLPEVQAGPAESLLLIDCRFFLGMVRNPVGTPIVSLARRLKATLATGRVSATAVLLFDPIESPDYPLENGFMPWLLWDLLASPGDFESDIPEKWKQFEAGESARYFMLYPEAYKAYRKYLEADPGDASIHYRIAQMAALDQVPQYALESVETAAGLDPAYRKAYAELGLFLFEKGVNDLAEDALKAGLARFPADPVIASTLARIHLAWGEKLLHSGNPAGSLPHFRAAAAVEGADPSLLEHARTLLRAMPASP